jgi:prepilin-type N-terminal cleavage/methylation domain-containing protein
VIQRQHGTSLVEVLAGLLLVSVLASMASTWARAVLLSARVQEQATVVQEGAGSGGDGDRLRRP